MRVIWASFLYLNHGTVPSVHPWYGAPQSCSARGLRVDGWPMALAVGDTNQDDRMAHGFSLGDANSTVTIVSPTSKEVGHPQVGLPGWSPRTPKVGSPGGPPPGGTPRWATRKRVGHPEEVGYPTRSFSPAANGFRPVIVHESSATDTRRRLTVRGDPHTISMKRGWNS